MLNKYTLTFLYQEQTVKYLEHNSPKIIREHLNFTLYGFAFSLLNLIQFILAGSLVYSLLAGMSCVLIISLQYMISKKPALINIVISFYQIYVLFIIEINNILATSQKADQSLAWSYGYQTCFMHFCLYLQATEMFFSTFILLLTSAVHLSFTTFNEVYSIVHILSFFVMLICMVAVKYNYEKRKREEFFYSYQQEQWERIIKQAVSNTIILIRYDSKQDQLRLAKQSIKSENTHNIKDCQSLRAFLRALMFIDSVNHTKFVDEGNNLEQQIRNILIQQSDLQKPKHQKYCIDQINKIIYRVKLSKYILNNEIQCLLILDKVQVQENKSQEMQVKLFNELTKKVLKTLKHSFLYFDVKQQKYDILPHAFLQSTLFNVQILTTQLEFKIKNKSNEIISHLKHIFGNKVRINCDVDFKINKNLFFSIISACCKLVLYVDDELPSFCLNFEEIEPFQIELLIQFKVKQSSQTSIYSILSANWISSNRRQFNQKQLYECCIDRICRLASIYDIPKILLLDISVAQIIMSRICLYNHFKIYRNSQNIEFMCTFNKNIE